MSELLLSRTLDPEDYTHLEEETAWVDRYTGPRPHVHRRWEYALALHAIAEWRGSGGGPWGGPVYDVGGGSGSEFPVMLQDFTNREVVIIDPTITDGMALGEFVTQGGAPLAHVVTCLSVIEHVADVDEFAYHLGCLVAPSGLLVLTMDYSLRCGPDTTANRDLRAQLFCPKTYARLRNTFAGLHLTAFGGVDPAWHGYRVWDYTFASLVLEKRA